MSSAQHRLTREEEDLLPYDYTNAYYQVITEEGETFRTYRATWGIYQVWCDYTPDGNWRIYEPKESEITESHWLQVYPGI
jgi:hypothetical protein